MDILSGMERFTFGIPVLIDGVGLAPVAMGLFGISEVFLNLETPQKRDIFKTRIKGLLPNVEDWKKSLWPIIRARWWLFPGHPARRGRRASVFYKLCNGEEAFPPPRTFRPGRDRGGGRPGDGEQRRDGGAFIPLAHPGDPVERVMGDPAGRPAHSRMQPGPMLIKQHPELFWGAVTSMYLGNGLLLVLTCP